jgi:hypothetical protein
MRKFVSIAAIILASTAAHAGDQRSLSTNSTSMTTTVPAPAPEPRAADSLRASYNDPPPAAAPRTDTPRYAPPPAATTAQTDQPAPPAVPDAPRYNARPAPVESPAPAPATTASTPPATTTPSTVQDTPRNAPYRVRSRAHYASGAPYSRSHAYAPRYAAYGWRAHRHARWAGYKYRIIAQLHRYGIYW